ncbi:hypothetical protein Pfo_025933, partial [Paulownia fortunei]
KESKLVFLIMKTIIILFLASVLILATFQAHAETLPVKNRHLLSDFGRGNSAANKGSQEDQSDSSSEANNIGSVDNNNEETSTPDQNTHHYLPDQDYKPKNSPPRRYNSP